ncbi:uncharacterized protein SCODWIG_03042 [Saccharomycodes ludwigii]|uniref:Uncharacterized protein n=1 Tax=Saccharomycodes ludwigii TaxID=36035 RepID=A0A376B9I4_9ASCO|nr:hypothetical protein SCDLUD_000033 [Saccharomycodes ludwigii]KAH3902456.1 hypothetical protein SCDLUD_000033 [Saccharomycodes ludwigii]SSD61281.1 uncharacterized protein SCODWIG_03042 [Saccharomycodes ludwigii]
MYQRPHQPIEFTRQDSDLNVYLQNVEELDKQRRTGNINDNNVNNNEKKIIPPSINNHKRYNHSREDIEKSRRLLTAPTNNYDNVGTSYETSLGNANPISKSTNNRNFYSAYSYDRIYSSTGTNELSGDLNPNKYVISEDDYELLQTVKFSMNGKKKNMNILPAYSNVDENLNRGQQGRVRINYGLNNLNVENDAEYSDSFALSNLSSSRRYGGNDGKLRNGHYHDDDYDDIEYYPVELPDNYDLPKPGAIFKNLKEKNSHRSEVPKKPIKPRKLSELDINNSNYDSNKYASSYSFPFAGPVIKPKSSRFAYDSIGMDNDYEQQKLSSVDYDDDDYQGDADKYYHSKYDKSRSRPPPIPAKKSHLSEEISYFEVEPPSRRKNTRTTTTTTTTTTKRVFRKPLDLNSTLGTSTVEVEKYEDDELQPASLNGSPTRRSYMDSLGESRSPSRIPRFTSSSSSPRRQQYMDSLGESRSPSRIPRFTSSSSSPRRQQYMDSLSTRDETSPTRIPQHLSRMKSSARGISSSPGKSYMDSLSEKARDVTSTSTTNKILSSRKHRDSQDTFWNSNALKNLSTQHNTAIVKAPFIPKKPAKLRAAGTDGNDNNGTIFEEDDVDDNEVLVQEINRLKLKKTVKEKPKVPNKKMELQVELPKLRKVKTPTRKNTGATMIDDNSQVSPIQLPKLRKSVSPQRTNKTYDEVQFPELKPVSKNINENRKSKKDEEALEPIEKIKKLNKAPPKPTRKPSLPEALKKINNLNKVEISPSRIVSIPEAITVRKTLLKSKTAPDHGSTSGNVANDLIKPAQIENPFIAGLKKNLSSRNTDIGIGSGNSTMYNTEANEPKLRHVTKNRSRGPKRRLPSNIVKN